MKESGRRVKGGKVGRPLVKSEQVNRRAKSGDVNHLCSSQPVMRVGGVVKSKGTWIVR